MCSNENYLYLLANVALHLNGYPFETITFRFYEFEDPLLVIVAPHGSYTLAPACGTSLYME